MFFLGFFPYLLVDKSPHIYGDGEVCWGSAMELVYRYLWDREYYLLVLLLINFLKSIDPNSYVYPLNGGMLSGHVSKSWFNKKYRIKNSLTTKARSKKPKKGKRRR